ncbi:hypothetical protein F383_05286 [Gossypium arboreum]|uniref:Uncharacterized protein n=1 Tax=Gossypium arboreum TaxID=29729 RepID=A0A0B0PHC7_GOSAR|nr:hypothetical protein F383_05286 [Gossypium arboreum]
MCMYIPWKLKKAVGEHDNNSGLAFFSGLS